MADEPIFLASERFSPENGDAWKKYIAWAKLPALVELVTLDGSLCPHLPATRIDEDWEHIVRADYLLEYYLNLPYLLNRVRDVDRVNILGLYRNPSHEIAQPPAHGFAFAGYDLIENETQISALTNCGGFPDVFRNDELNQLGLLQDFARGKQVQDELREKHPEEAHAQCDLYAVWRLRRGS